jgi:hypothetical protein
MHLDIREAAQKLSNLPRLVGLGLKATRAGASLQLADFEAVQLDLVANYC